MKNQESILEIFGIKILTIRIINIGAKNIYLFSIPFLSIRKSNNITKINLLILHRLHIKIKNNYALWSKKRKNRKKRKDIIKRFKKGKKVKICLMVQRPGTWCFDYLYKILEQDSRFEPIVFILPDPAYGVEAQLEYIDLVYKELEPKGYNIIKGRDTTTKKFVGIRKDINPDIFYYTDFGKWHYHKENYITYFLDKISFLTDYGFSVMDDQFVCTFELNNLVDLYLRPTIFHKTMAERLMKNKGSNVVVTGSPKLDTLFDKNFKPTDIWKPQEKPKKRIIWSPHHSASEKNPDQWMMDSFYKLYDFMLEIAEKYKDEVQFVFRPHPILKSSLVKKWGSCITKQYYDKWAKGTNTQYYTGNINDLFATSDAMIMDCLSFMAEYTAFNKPLFHTATDTCRIKLNEFGEILYKNFYIPTNELKEDIENFIQDVVINGNDYKKEQRTQFVKQYFGKINGKTASENIYDEIIKFLEKGEV